MRNLNKLKGTVFQILKNLEVEEMSISSTYYVSEALISFDLHYEVGIINCMSQIRTLTESG